jgi:DNA-binding transcriptional LysR family regulator
MRGNQDDLYIMVYPPEDLEVVSYPFLDNELVVIAPGPLGGSPASRTRALSGERFILREVGSGSRRTIDAHLRRSG